MLHFLHCSLVDQNLVDQVATGKRSTEIGGLLYRYYSSLQQERGQNKKYMYQSPQNV